MSSLIQCESLIGIDNPQKDRGSYDEGILELNVGGQYFTTTRETLSAAGQSFFSGLISGSFGILRDSKGCVFIDRDRESCTIGSPEFVDIASKVSLYDAFQYPDL